MSLRRPNDNVNAMMKTLQRLQRLLGSRTETTDSDPQALDGWAEARGHRLKRVRRGEGRVVEFEWEGRRGRLEWGPSKRAYIAGQELRVCIEAGLPQQLEMLLMSRSLAQRLDSQAYQTLVQDHQTGIDTTLPEEVRWLSMLERVPVPSTVAGYVMLSSSPPHAQRWLEGDLLSRVSRAAHNWLGDDAPLVLMTLRGRVYLRTEALVTEVAMLDGACNLANAAAASARLLMSKTTPVAREVSSGRLVHTSRLDEPSVMEIPMDSDMMALGMPSRVGPRTDIPV
ncbi:hypothetical protein [Sphaerotilus sp.]|uniref:hypothetical protein n=1 Tax=Sphaerotilus sp. TaxID=2093942 RepID=UPI002ACEFBE8|nr:hypothetical protein [Sphaerotilus sp.]MDZ7858566.1 hypothetical protein [Sphaerotilus sp.]